MKILKKVLFICLITFLGTIPTHVLAEDIYDVVLFWGQSNMRGSAGESVCSDGKTEINHIDENLKSGSDAFAEITGIHTIIASRYKTMGYVDVPVEDGSAYEYLWLDNKLQKLNVKRIGELISPSGSGNNLTFTKTDKGSKNTFIPSAGTNMVPWFCKTYHDRTGHKIVVVMAANTGRKINWFLPYDKNASQTSLTGTNKEYYMYEAMTRKYKAAIAYLKSKNYTIGNRFDVIFQGESDVEYATQMNETNWRETYESIHKLLKKELGIEFSLIVETAGKSGEKVSKGIDIIHKAQEDASKYNSDVIIGSSYAYERFVPVEADYKGTFLKKKMSYREALKIARMSTGYQCNNVVHYNAAALSQIGYQTAKRAADYVTENLTYKGKGGSVKVTFNCNGGTGGGSQTFTDGVSGQKFSKTCTRTGYIQSGWNTKADGTGEHHATASGVSYDWINRKSPAVTLYAEWKSSSVVVTFNCNGGKGGGNQTFTYGVSGQKFSKTCTRTGYIQNGWNKKIDGTGDKYATTSGVSYDWINRNAPSLTLYAQWVKMNPYIINHYKVDYIGKEIGKIESDTDLTSYKEKFNLPEGYSIKVDLTDHKSIYTGSITKIYYQDKEVGSFINIVRGDINGDGIINSKDLLNTKTYLLKVKELEEANAKAADTNDDDIVNSGDLLRIKKHVLGTKKID